jgi:hypothetical protein
MVMFAKDLITKYPYLTIGSSPSEEECAQVGQPGYAQKAKLECERFIALIRIYCGKEPAGNELRIISNEHPFGEYLEVVCHYEPDDDVARQYAMHVERYCPSTWEGMGSKKFVPVNAKLHIVIRELILHAVFTTDSYKPEKVMPVIHDYLGKEESKDAEIFLKWADENSEKFGRGTIDDVYALFKING